MLTKTIRYPLYNHWTIEPFIIILFEFYKLKVLQNLLIEELI